MSDGKGNLSNIAKHLERMEHCDKIIYQDVHHFSEPMESRDLCLLENKSMSDLSLVSSKKSVDRGAAIEYLPQEHIIQKGKCVIINEENFSTNAQNQVRFSKKFPLPRRTEIPCAINNQ